MAPWRNLILTLACLSLGAAAPPKSRSKPEQPSVSAENRRRAQALFRQSEVAFQDGRMDEASELLRRAYRIDPHPVLLYNLARSEESAGRLKAAKVAYERYLEANPNAEDRSFVEQRISVLTRQIEQEDRLSRLPAPRAESSPQVAPPVEIQTPVEPDTPSIAAPITILTLGLAGIGAGVVLGTMANQRQSDAEDAPSHLAAIDAKDEADQLALGANVAYAAGGAVAVGGLVWLVTRLTSSANEAAISEVIVGPDGAAVVGRW